MILGKKIILVSTILSALFATPAIAGTYGDDFGKCLVRSSTDADKQQLVEWIFSAISLNPGVARYTNIPEKDRSILNKNMASLFERLVGESCQKEASEAMKYEGASAFSSAFQLLGQVAGQQLFASPEVSAGADEFIKFIDEKALQERLGIKTDKP